MSSKSILIISFFFPPFPRVGGRRWAKFAKYLIRNGYNVTVLCAKYDNHDKSPWDNDIKEFENNIVRIPLKKARYPFHRRNKQPRSFSGKIRYRISFYYENLLSKLIKGDHFDESIKHSKKFHDTCLKLIKENGYKNIIVSASPFRYSYEIGKIKKQYPDINFILDLRDFWEDWMHNIPDKKRLYERKLEEKTLGFYDKIISPAERIINRLKKKYPQYEKKFKTIPHAFDKDDLENNTVNALRKRQNREIRFVYAGYFYPDPGIEINIKLIVQLMLKFKELNQTPILHFYTYSSEYQNYFNNNGLKENVFYQPLLNVKSLFTKIKNEYDFLIYMRGVNSNDKHFMSTKFYEQVALGLPILYVGPSGDVSDFLLKNKLGIFLQNDNLPETINRINNNFRTNEIPSKNYDINLHSFETITRQLELELK